MPSVLKTAFLELNKWAGNEYVKRTDFVSDNEKIDTFAENVNTQMAQKANTTDLTDKLDKTGGALSGDLVLSGGALIKRASDASNLLINGGQNTTITSGAYIELQGINLGGAGLGGNASIAVAAGKRLQVANGYLTIGSNTDIRFGGGSPEGSVAASVGSMYLRTDGGASTTLYVKQSGTGNTGWVGK